MGRQLRDEQKLEAATPRARGTTGGSDNTRPWKRDHLERMPRTRQNLIHHFNLSDLSFWGKYALCTFGFKMKKGDTTK